MEEEVTQNKVSKQTSIENLSEEELRSKYKSLLTILKKAKTSKDEAVAENDRLKSEQAKVILEMEEDRNRVERELETMQEIVTNLTENKMVLVTKNESLQRQLNVQLSEVETLKKFEGDFIEEREIHLKEINKLRLATTKQQKVVEQLKEERDKIANLVQNETWENEKLQLLDKIDSMEAQMEQIEVLKSKCKTLLTERDDALQKLREVVSRPSIEDEKKAMEIVHNELKSQKIVLEEKFKTRLKENDALKLKITEMDGIYNQLLSTEETLCQCKVQLGESRASRLDMEKELETSVTNIKKLEDDLTNEREKYFTLDTLHEEIKLKLKESSERNMEMEKEMKNFNNENGSFIDEKDELIKKIERYKGENKELNERIESYKVENGEMIKNIESFEGEKFELNQTIKCCREENNELNKRIERFEKERNELNVKMNNYKEELNELNKRKESYESEKNELNEKIERYTEENNKLINRIENFEGEKCELDQAIQSCREGNNELNHRIESYEVEKNELNQKIESYEKEKSELNQTIENYREKENELNNRIENHMTEKNELNKRMESYEEEKNGLNNRIESFIEEKNELTQSLESLSEEKNELHKRIESYEEEKNEFTQKLNFYNEEKNELIQKIECENEGKNELNRRIESFIEEKNELTQRLECLNEEKNELIKKMERDNEDKNELNKMIESYEKEKSELNQTIENYIEEKNELIASYEEEKNVLNRKVESLEASNESINENSEAKLLLDALQSENKTKAIKIENLESENENLNNLFSSIKFVFNSKGDDIGKDEILLRIQDFVLNSNENSSKYEQLKSNTLKLVNLVNNFYFQSFDVIEASEDLNKVLNDSFNHLELIGNEFKNSNLEELLNSWPAYIKEICLHIENLESLLVYTNNTEQPPIMEALPFNLSKSLLDFFNNSQQVCNVLSKLLNFITLEDLRDAVTLSETKIKELETILLEGVNNKRKIVIMTNELKKYEEKIEHQDSVLEENNQTILSRENDLKILKEIHNETLKQKELHEETLQSVSKMHEETNEILKSREQELEEEKQNSHHYKEEYESLYEEIVSLREQLKGLTKEFDKLSSELDDVMKERDKMKQKIMAFETDIKQTDGRGDAVQDAAQLKLQMESVLKEKKLIENTLQSCLDIVKGKNPVHFEDQSNILSGEPLETERRLDITKVEELQKLNESLKERYESLTSEKSTYDTKLKSSETIVSNLKKEKEFTNKYFNCLKIQLEKSIAVEQGLRANQEVITKEKEILNENILSLKLNFEEKEQYSMTMKDELNNLKSVYEILCRERESVKEKLVSNESELTNLSKDKETLENKCDELKNELENINTENNTYKIQIEDLEKELTKYKQMYEEMDELTRNSSAQMAQLRLEKEILKTNVKTLEAKVIVCVKSYKSNENETWNETEQSEDNIENCDGKEENSERIEVENATQAASAEASSRYTEIITELNEMNQIIRKRGEKISLLEDELYQKQANIKELTDKLEELQGQLSTGEEELASKQELLQKIQSSTQDDTAESVPELKEKIAALEEENIELKKTIESETNSRISLHTVPVDTHSEVMSTSTISKMDESSRMKELEDTFEERYMKLKNLAIKLKKKLLEQTAEIKALEESKKKLLSEKEEMAKKGHVMASKNIQVLQTEIDKLQDSLDANQKELKEREKQLVVCAQETSDLKSRLVLLEEENSLRHIEIKNSEESLVLQMTLNESLQGQVAALEKRLLIEEEKIVNFKEEQRKMEERVEEQKIKREQLNKELDEAKQEGKKHSLIDLEMKDYERSIEDMATQAKEKDNMIIELRNKLANDEGRVLALTEEISLLKQQIECETDRAEKLKKTVSDYKTELSKLRGDQESQINRKEKDRETIEYLNQEMEKQKLMLAELSSQSSKIEAKLRKEKDIAENKVEILEEKLEKKEKLSENLKEELNSLQKEFEAYKVRAQNVLRQKSKIPQQSYEDLKSEKEHLTVDLEAVQIRAHQLQSELSATKAELGYLSSEKEKLALQVSNLHSVTSKKELLLDEQIASWEKKFEAKISEYQVIINDMSSQTEAMNRNYKAQLESEKERHFTEIQKLESKLEESEDKVWQLKNASLPLKNNNNGKMESQPEGVFSLAPHHTRKASHGGGAGFGDEHRLDVANMIREEGEGSEWVEPHPQRSPGQRLYNPPSLEQLLNNPFPSQQHSLDESLSVVSAATEFTSKEVAKLEQKLSSYETRIQQLTTLLTESESENAKLVQLSDTLKEEIRRTFRNEKREKHLENNEYLKNVILKFISLKTGDEKFRLVPVLKTLLQLSPDEATNIAIIAKGDDPQNVPQGWGNYLHLWSGR